MTAAVLERPSTVTIDELIDSAARFAVIRYRQYVTEADVQDALWRYVMTDEAAQSAICQDLDHPRLVLRHLQAVAQQYGEAVKAAASGYRVDDVAYYSQHSIRLLLPFALDPEWDGNVPHEFAFADASRKIKGRDVDAGSFAASVMDVRIALKGCPAAARVILTADETSTEYRSACRQLIDHLGGPKPNILIPKGQTR